MIREVAERNCDGLRSVVSEAKSYSQFHVIQGIQKWFFFDCIRYT
jgi:hypothetical protein